MRIQTPIDVLTVQELHDKLETLIAEGKGNYYIAVPVCSSMEYDGDYTLANGEIETTDRGKTVWLNALTSEEDSIAAMILGL